MEIINLEFYSLTISTILILDHLTKFKNYLTKLSVIWFVLILSIFFQTITNILLCYLNNYSMHLITINILFTIISSLCIYVYIVSKYVTDEINVKQNVIRAVIFLAEFLIFLIIFLFLFKDSFISENMNSKFIFLNLIPLLYTLFTYIIHCLKSKTRLSYKIIFILLLVIACTIIYFINPNLYYLSCGYTIFALILYLLKHDIIMNTDPLTGLLNKKVLEGFIMNLKPKSMVAVFNIDVDSFKKINDTYGHSTGDKILKDISNILISSTRNNDYVFRNGGDEFLIISYIRNVSDKDFILERLNENLISYNQKKKIKIGLSIGSDTYIAKSKNTSIDFKNFLKSVDDKMYKIKQKKKKLN